MVARRRYLTSAVLSRRRDSARKITGIRSRAFVTAEAWRQCKSVANGKTHRTELIGSALRLELSRPEHVRVGEPETIPGQCRAIIQIAHEDILVHMAAVLPSIAIEKDVVRYRASVDTHKDISAQCAL